MITEIFNHKFIPVLETWYILMVQKTSGRRIRIEDNSSVSHQLSS